MMSVITSGMMSSNTDQWATPKDLFDKLDDEFHFTLDVCADETNYKVSRYFDVKMDSLKQDWTKDISWMNPPYGRVIPKWVHKAVETAAKGGVVVGLLPARTDTKWWADVMKATELRFIKGRVRFGNSDTGAPFPSVIAVWGTPRVPVISIMEL